MLAKVNKIIHNDINNFIPDDDKQRMVDWNLYNDIFLMVKSRLVISSPGISPYYRWGKKSAPVDINSIEISPQRRSHNRAKSQSRRENPTRLSVSPHRREKREVTFDLT